MTGSPTLGRDAVPAPKKEGRTLRRGSRAVAAVGLPIVSSLVLLGLLSTGMAGPFGLLAQEASTSSLVIVPHLGNCNTTENSTNWAGYVTETCSNPPKTSIVQNVSGEWVVPTATCTPGQLTRSAMFIGIDGYNGPGAATLEQIGTMVMCSRANGATYFPWFEMVPSPVVQISMPIAPGDTIYATVTEGGGHFFLTIRDATNGQSFSTIQNNFKAMQASAEWIVEGNIGGSELTDFGAVTFFNCNVVFYGVSGSISGGYWAHVPQNLTNGNQVVVGSTGPLQSGGAKFVVTYTPLGPCQSSTSYSYEWGGYVVRQCPGNMGPITGVQGTWVQPAPAPGFQCPAASPLPTLAVFGVGLGGYTSIDSQRTFQGIGTLIHCFRGSVGYNAWVETPISAKGSLSMLKLAIQPGDTITASVTFNAAQQEYDFAISDVTSGGSTSLNFPAPPGSNPPSSAEWIVGQGWNWGGYSQKIDLLDFGTVNFRACSVTLGGVTGAINGNWQNVALTLTRGSWKAQRTLVTTSALVSGNSFSVTWVRPG